MRKFTKLLLTAALLIVGIMGANAEVKTDWNPSDAYATTWNSETNTLSWNKTWANVLYTGFAPKTNGNTTEVDLSIYSKIHYNITSLTGTASDADGAYIDLKVRSTGKDDFTIKLREGANDIVFANYAETIDFSKILELTVSATYADGAEDGAPGSAVITEMYLYTNRYKYETQQQTVTTYTLGTALSLASISTDNTLVSIASGNNILYGTHQDNQIYAKSIEEAMSAVEARGANESTYRFRISESTDADVTMPEGVTTLYRIQAFKGDGSVKYTGPWGGDSYLNDIGWTYNIAGSDDGCYFAITPVDGKDNTYKISSYKKDGTKRREDIYYDKSEWTFNVISKSETTKDVDVLVEIQVEDTEDPGIAAVPEGWKSLITNGKLEDNDVTNFWTKNEDGNNPIAAVRDATAGRMGGPGIKVVTKDNAGTDWGTQFFIKSSEPLKEGQKLHIEFDYRADRPQKAATQVHRAPGDYNANIDEVNFTVNWQHYSKEFTIEAGHCKQDNGEGIFYLQSFGLNLSQIRSTSNFYFDNIVMWTEDDPLKPQKVALQNAIAKGEAQNSYAKTTESFATLTGAITDGETALAAADATESSLTNATTAIENAINGLKLLDGYSKLTKDMYYTWNSATAPDPVNGSSNAGACDYVLFASTSQPYGHGSVPLLSFADLSTFDKFEIIATGGTPRILLNRDIDNGQWSENEAESHLIDNTKGSAESWHAKYYAKEENTTTVDLKQLAKDKGFAHLHTIKTVNGNVTVSDMLLYRTVTVAEQYATFGTLYKTAKLNGVKTYAAKYADGKVTLTEVESGNVPAGKGVVVEATEAGSYAPTFDVEAENIESDLLVSNGTVKGDDIYVLAKKLKGLGFYKLAATDAVPAGKAYLKIKAPASETAREFIAIAGETTGIETVKTVKAEQGIFNMAGQRLVKAQKGLNIINGKKVIK